MHRILVWPRTFRGLAILFALAAAVVIAVLGHATLWRVHHELEMRLDAQIQIDARNLLDVERHAGFAALAAAVEERQHSGISYVAAHAGSMRPQMIYLLLDGHGHRVAGDLQAQLPRPGYTEFIYFSRPDGSIGTAQGVNVPTHDGGRLIVAADRAVIYRIDRQIVHFFLMGFCAILLIGALSTYILIHIFRTRLHSFERLALAVTAGRVEERIALDGSGIEFDRLSAIVNGMLDRISVLVANLRTVSTALAHDLRTPLSRIRSRVEMAERAEQDVGKKQRLDSTLGDIDDLLELFAGLLALSELEGHRVRDRFEAVALDKAIADIAEAHRPAAEDTDKVLHVRVEPVDVLGDKALLQRMVGNLLDNAMVHTPASATIEVTVAQQGDQAVIRVIDDGPGVPHEYHEHIFERLVRLDSSRSSPGHGLGLSMVSAIVAAHGGAVAVVPAALGLTIEVRLPTID